MYAADGWVWPHLKSACLSRLFVADGSPFGRGRWRSGCGFQACDDQPVLFDMSEEENAMEEGCLSIPGIREPVSRPDQLGVEYYDARLEFGGGELMAWPRASFHENALDD